MYRVMMTVSNVWMETACSVHEECYMKGYAWHTVLDSTINQVMAVCHVIQTVWDARLVAHFTVPAVEVG